MEFRLFRIQEVLLLQLRVQLQEGVEDFIARGQLQLLRRQRGEGLARIARGEFVSLNAHAALGHDVQIGAFSTLSAYVDLTGAVKVGRCAFFGTGSRVMPNLSIGDNCVIGAGAVCSGKCRCRASRKLHVSGCKVCFAGPFAGGLLPRLRRLPGLALRDGSV